MPKGESDKPMKAFIIDSWFDNYLGIVVLIKIINGSIKLKDKIKVISNKESLSLINLGRSILT